MKLIARLLTGRFSKKNTNFHYQLEWVNVIKFLGILFLMLLMGSVVCGCSKPPDQKAYEEIVTTMSMEKAKKFFDNYRQSQYRDRLVNEIIEWSKNEGTESGFRIIMEALPKDHPRYKEVVTYYERRFGEKK